MSKIARGLSWLWPVLVAGAALAGDAKQDLTIHYTFDEPTGVTAHDLGTAKADGTLSTTAPIDVQDAGFTSGPADQWQPILRNGAQVKNLKPGSDHLLLDAEAPVVFDRNTDYAIDSARGLIKALPSGRIRPGDRIVVGLTYSYAGPERVAGRQGLALKFNGKDAFVDCGDPDGLAAVSALTVDLWFQLPDHWNQDGLLLTKGQGLSLGFEKGKLVFNHSSLSIKATGTPAALEIKPNAWHHLIASYSKGAVVVKLDDQEQARSDHVTGALAGDGLLRLGGAVDPHFFDGLMDDVLITYTPAKDP